MLSNIDVMKAVGNMSELTLEGTYAARCAAATKMKGLVGMEQHAYVSTLAPEPEEVTPPEEGETPSEEGATYTDPAEGIYADFVQAESIFAVMYHLPTRNISAEGSGGVATSNSQHDGQTNYMKPAEIEELQGQFLEQAMMILQPYIDSPVRGIRKASERHGRC